MLQHTASYRNMLTALKHAATLVSLMIRQRTFKCVANRGVVTKEASQGIKRNWSCVCIARLRYAANLEACSLYERDLDIIIHLPCGFFPINIIVSLSEREHRHVFTQPCLLIVQTQALPKNNSLTSLSSPPFLPHCLQLLQGVQEKDICFCCYQVCLYAHPCQRGGVVVTVKVLEVSRTAFVCVRVEYIQPSRF